MTQLLLDTNIFLEIILDQERSLEAKRVLAKAEEYNLFITDFSFHSIGLLLFRQKQQALFQTFTADTLLCGAIAMVTL